MEASKEHLVAEVREMINIFSPGGGHVLAPCNHMIDVTPENVLSMFETAWEYVPGNT